MRIVVDTPQIESNTRAVVDLCATHGLSVVGVTKCVQGEPAVALAMLRGGVTMLGESRLANVKRLRASGVDAPLLLLRLPCLSEVADVVRHTQYSVNSEAKTIFALSKAATEIGTRHGVLISVDTGDRREGVLPRDAAELCRLVLDLPGLDLAGVGTCLSCLCGVVPTSEKHEEFAELAEWLEDELDLSLPMVSFGHTVDLPVVMRDSVPTAFNQIRIGGALLVGNDNMVGYHIPNVVENAFKAYAEVIEVQTKPSMPDGELGVDAFFRTPEWSDLGMRRRAILAMGEMDLATQFIRPTLPGAVVVGATSDHLVVDVTDAESVQLGDEMEFVMSYTAIAYAWSSAHAEITMR